MSNPRRVDDPQAEHERIARQVASARPLLLLARELAEQDDQAWRDLAFHVRVEYIASAQQQLAGEDRDGRPL